jgi:hypothetical protein
MYRRYDVCSQSVSKGHTNIGASAIVRLIGNEWNCEDSGVIVSTFSALLCFDMEVDLEEKSTVMSKRE